MPEEAGSMTTREVRVCSTCLYWDRFKANLTGRAIDGLCRISPPDKSPNPWPPTSENAWCGEYAPKSSNEPYGPQETE